MKLCGHSVSPYVERVLIALEMKGEQDAVSLSDVPGGFKSEEHYSHHPLGKIPFLLMDDGSSLTESQVIVEYLDAVLGGNSLVPADPLSAAHASRIVRVLDVYYTHAIGPMGRVAFGGSASDEELAMAKDNTIPAALGYLDVLIGDDGFAIGNGYTHADAALMSQFYWFDRLMPQFGIKGFEGFPKLAAYWEKAQEGEIYKASKTRADASFNKFFAKKDA